MGIEIERKFLVDMTQIGPLKNGVSIIQGYIQTCNQTTVRVRIIDDNAFITLKGITTGASRVEFEYPIPIQDAGQIIKLLCYKHTIAKMRYRIPYRGHTWEIDIFEKNNKGLVVAEIELKHEQERFEKPPWLQQEVTGDIRYYNANLIQTPYCSWEKA